MFPYLSLPTSTDDPALPRDVNPAAIAQDLADDGVAAPADVAPALVKQVAAAREKGIDLNVVYYPGTDADFTAPRNLAELLKDDVSGTILVLNDSQVGSVSPVYPRYVLERSEHNIDTVVGAKDLYAPQVVVQVDTFVRDVSHPPLPWGPISGACGVTCALAAAVIAVAFRRRLPVAS